MASPTAPDRTLDPPIAPDRRRALVAAAGFAVTLAAPVRAASLPVVAILGDSIAAGYGLTVASQALPARLEAELVRTGAPARVIGAGVSGDTTAGALRRLDRSVGPNVDVCVVELGGNDLMNGVPPAAIRGNLDAIVSRLKARRIRVVLTGMRAPPVLDPAYVRAFDAVFPEIARRHGTLFYPFLLDGVALDSRFNQRDRIHPNAAGVQIIARRLAPVVARALLKA